MIEREGLKEDWSMTTYLLALILAVGIPFLLYCLWNFGRELRPRTSRAVLSSQFVAPRCPQRHTNVSVQKPTAQRSVA